MGKPIMDLIIDIKNGYGYQYAEAFGIIIVMILVVFIIDRIAVKFIKSRIEKN